MPDFVWRAARADSQIVEGRLQGASHAQAMQLLRAQGLTPLHISEAGAGAGTGPVSAGSAAAPGLAPLASSQAPQPSRLGGIFSSGTINQADILVMTSELSIMLKAGLALDNALRVLIGMNAKPAAPPPDAVPAPVPAPATLICSGVSPWARSSCIAWAWLAPCRRPSTI